MLQKTEKKLSPSLHSGSSSDHLQINSVTITPDPPVKGQNITVAANGDLSMFIYNVYYFRVYAAYELHLDEVITDGTINLLIKYDGFITVVKKTEDICTSGDVTCPIAAGNYTESVTEFIPSSVPSVCFPSFLLSCDIHPSPISSFSMILCYRAVM